MKRIGLLSDTHGFIEPKLFDFFAECDEIWHAGDFGNFETLEHWQHSKPYVVSMETSTTTKYDRFLKNTLNSESKV